MADTQKKQPTLRLGEPCQAMVNYIGPNPRRAYAWGATWNNRSTTQQIVRTLVRQGVATVVGNGDLPDPMSWILARGPRFEEAVAKYNIRIQHPHRRAGDPWE